MAVDLDEFFKKATGNSPFPFQRTFACEGELPPPLVGVPTGLGKTAMVVLGWLWRRFESDQGMKSATPRRLVYCLPMRVLVEQTRDNAIRWLHNLGLLAGKVSYSPTPSPGEPATSSHRIEEYTPCADDPGKVPVYVLMGGEDEEDWDIYPERDAIIIGTQDMLLSRALNRGYAASRSRWPMQFGLLHTDCLWVFDEIQLMGSGLATTTQLEAFRRFLSSINGHGCHSVWMSATMQRDWLKTVDFRNYVDSLMLLGLDDKDHSDGEVERRRRASKPISKAEANMGDAKKLAEEIETKHKRGTRTIVVLNTVKRARALYDELKKKLRTVEGPQLVLLHSRFRPPDRAKAVESALAAVNPDGPGTITVSTQVIEAGVDVSATTLFTELAPWASLVQRFGRCNRRGDDREAHVFWIDLPDNPEDKDASPYLLEHIEAARDLLNRCTDGVGPAALDDVARENPEEHENVMRFEHAHVIRRKDLIDLFDTTPDLAGNDIDIDRFVREVEESDVHVFWREWSQSNGQDKPPDSEPAPRREELCPVPIGEFKKFVSGKKREGKVWRWSFLEGKWEKAKADKVAPGQVFLVHGKKREGKVWRWSFLEGKWEKAKADKVAPGQVFLVHADAGGYSAEKGFDPNNKTPVKPLEKKGGADGQREEPDSTDNDALSQIGFWQTIGEHTQEVFKEIETFHAVLDSKEIQALELAARWHDAGKAHGVFQAALPEGVPDPQKIWAKASEQSKWKRYERPHFRHELASALAVLLAPERLIPNGQRDLVAYLVAAHHGKVRLSIRSLPNETRPNNTSGGSRRFARGVWDGDFLPETDLGDGVIAPRVTNLSLEPMELGLCEEPPFEGQPSWIERMTRLRDTLGPFRLAFLEAILRAADMRASKAAAMRAAGDHGAAISTQAKEADCERDSTL